ncbi:MAG TPA: DoxX family protein [Phycisphaerales bacterium]|nr:DoxX family protein [Phycisphaerales bacterium]
MKGCTDNTCRAQGTGGCGLSLRSGVPAVVRMVLGGLLILAGWTKLGIYGDAGFFDTTAYRNTYDAVHAFHLGLGEQPLQIIARALPWAELLTGLLLVIGLWTRGAAVVAIAMMLAFIGGIASLMLRGMDVKCGCFGALKLFCGDQPMGWCHIIRNTVLAGAGLLVLLAGPGVPALDNCRKPAQSPKP